MVVSISSPMSYACGSSIAPEIEVTQSAPIAQVQDTNQITQNTVAIWTNSEHTILTTVYDDPDTEKNGDVLCQTVLGTRSGDMKYGSNVSTSTAVSCVTLGEK